jgi:hypothetical protein
MLQRSNYKARPASWLEIYPVFTVESDLPAPAAALARYGGMGHFAGVDDLRNLLSLASKLRRLAEETLHQGDKDLYLTAATVLEARASTMASALPGNPFDPETDARLHRPVNMTI